MRKWKTSLIRLLLIAIFTVSFRAGNRYSADALTSIRSRVDKLGERLKHMEKMEVRIVHLEKQGKEFTQFISTLDRSDNILREQLNKLAKEIERLQKRMPSVAAKHKTPQAMQEKPISKAETGYHEVRPGDTLFKIAKEYGIHVDELCRLNNLTRSQIIHPGQKLMVAPGDHQ